MFGWYKQEKERSLAWAGVVGVPVRARVRPGVKSFKVLEIKYMRYSCTVSASVPTLSCLCAYLTYLGTLGTLLCTYLTLILGPH